MLLGCIGDDFTGSSDIANTLAKGGMQVVQYTGIPHTHADPEVEAGVISLKSRTIPVEEAVKQSIGAAKWLLDQGCIQLYFKYCSTFDSTPQGNIGPVAEALAELLQEDKVIFCPAFPETGRSIYQGNLFVGDTPLHESGMKDHPLTPMTDSNLVRWLSLQTEKPVHHLPYDIVKDGVSPIRAFLKNAEAGFFIADAIDNQHLIDMGHAFSDRKLLTGGSGLAVGLPSNFNNHLGHCEKPLEWEGLQGRGVVLSGSCSVATRNQVEKYRSRAPYLEISADEIMSEDCSASAVSDWVHTQDLAPLIFTSADPESVRSAQEKYGREPVVSAIETFFGDLACKLVESGVRRIVSAGGETSGAIVSALNIKHMRIGPEISPGVPALRDIDKPLVLALKSGNFGGDDFFEEALEVLAG